MDLARVGAALLAPAPLVFAIRSVMHAMFLDPAAVPGLGPLTGLTGVLSLVGVGVLLWEDRSGAVPGASVVLAGHFVVSPYVEADLGAGLVYLGTAMLLASRAPRIVLAGTLALVGAIARGGPEQLGHALVAGGAAWLGVQAAWVARGRAE